MPGKPRMGRGVGRPFRGQEKKSGAGPKDLVPSSSPEDGLFRCGGGPFPGADNLGGQSSRQPG